jgi:hypothetical protein
VSRRAYIKQRFIHHSSHLVQRQSVETIQPLPLVIWRITNYSVHCSNQAETQKNNGMEQKSNHTQAPSGAPLIPRVLLCNNCRGDSSPDPRYYLLFRLLLRQELLGVAQPHICLFTREQSSSAGCHPHTTPTAREWFHRARHRGPCLHAEHQSSSRCCSPS